MAFGRAPIPNSADRRAWLRSFHYYRSKVLEENGAAVLDRVAPLMAAGSPWTPPAPKAGFDAPDETPDNEVSVDGAAIAEAPAKPTPAAKNEAPPELAGTPAGIHHSMPFFKEGRVFADPWRLPEKPKRVLKYLAAEAVAGEDGDLMVPEPDFWRKWTAKVNEQGYAIGSLRAFDILKGLRLAAILSELERADGRPIVWQVGPNATLARALKLRIPSLRLVITCEPWEMVTSVAYLEKSIPEAKVLVSGDAAKINRSWDDYDFIFAPLGLAQELNPPRLELLLDAMALELAPSDDLAAAFAAHAHALGALYVFSLTVGGEAPEWPRIDVTQALERHFWIHEMPVRPIIDWQIAAMMDEGYVARGFFDRPEEIKTWKLNVHFTMGWRRLKT